MRTCDLNQDDSLVDITVDPEHLGRTVAEVLGTRCQRNGDNGADEHQVRPTAAKVPEDRTD